MVPYPVAQGFIHSFQSAEIDLAGKKFLGIKRMAWDESCEGEVEYGNGPEPLGETIGQYMANLEIEQLLGEYMAFLTKLGNGYRAKRWNAGIQFNEPGVGLISVAFNSASILKPAVDASGKAGTTVKYTCRVFRPITMNGLSMINRARAGNTSGFSIGGAITGDVGSGLASFGAAVSANL